MRPLLAYAFRLFFLSLFFLFSLFFFIFFPLPLFPLHPDPFLLDLDFSLDLYFLKGVEGMLYFRVLLKECSQSIVGVEGRRRNEVSLTRKKSRTKNIIFSWRNSIFKIWVRIFFGHLRFLHWGFHYRMRSSYNEMSKKYPNTNFENRISP